MRTSQNRTRHHGSSGKVASSVGRIGVNKLSLLVSAAVGLLLLPVVHATPVRTSQIVDFATGNLGVVGTAEGWVGSSGNVTVTNGSGSLDGTGLGLTTSAGDKAETSASDGLTTYNLFANSGQFPANRTTNLYYSFLYRFNNAADVSTTFERIFQANRQNSGSAYTLQGVARSVSGQLQFGVLKTNGTPAFAATNLNAGETAFVVYRHQIIAGAGNDIVDLWVNPPPATFGVDEASVPPPSATATDGGEDSSNTGPGRFYLASGANATFDELRIGTNWADVTPPAGVCDPAGIASDPANLTVTADIPATFSIGATGTSVRCQWQVSTNAGSTWHNVNDGSGALSPTYTTPPLAVSDNGNQYRCRVAVACGGGSSATSGVATVTVNPYVITPSSLVVDDNWSDFSRANTPVGISNSVWFTSYNSAYLDASSGAMVGIPRSGSSMAWVGYFTDDTLTNLPVHLAVGSALKATLVFRASNIVSNGGTSLRIGLFDYAAGGTHLTADAGSFTGSTGNGTGVRGYMLGQDFGTNFSVNTPMTLYARSALQSPNLMGTTGDYASFGSGPAGLLLTNAPAFQSDTDYTLVFSVTRTNAASTLVGVSITGGGTNWSHTVLDNTYAYHRFDAIGIRANTWETTADAFTFTRFLVQVVDVPMPFRLTAIERLGADSVKLTWDSFSNRAYQVDSRESLSAGDWVSNTTATATSPSTSCTNSGVHAVPQRYYRVVNKL